ncbi:MAG: protein O-mannosyl-transferase family, partial [Acidimicrobiales bacterium]
GSPALERIAGGAGASLAAAFGFTAWQNSNETEVYMVATFSIAAICWLCLRWRDARGTPRAAHHLLVVAYLAALSIGNHLMTLLAGPAVSAFVLHVLRTAPSPDPAERRTEWSEWAVLSALWVVLIAVGLGSTPLLVLGAILFAAAAAVAVRARAVAFPIAALMVGAVGVSTYAFLYIRSGLDPVLDMSDPETWPRLLAMIRRDQYEARSPFDNPLFRSGPDNPGRTPLLVVQQMVNYFQYAGWQWARGLVAAPDRVRVGLGVFIALVFATLAVAGFVHLHRRDRSAAGLLGVLWLVTGVGMVGYMNFKPGFSLYWSQYRAFAQHEVRERDYFFTPSFQVWGVFAGLGLVAAGTLLPRGRRRAAVPLAAALVPFALNFTAASRRHGPDATLARDFAWNLLQSVEPYGVLFTFGDNDTYPIWYAQEVEGVRQDVVNVNLSLANAAWYLRHVRDLP